MKPWSLLVRLTPALSLGALLTLFAFLPELYAEPQIRFSAYEENGSSVARFRDLAGSAGYDVAALVTGPNRLADVVDPVRTAYVAVGVEVPYGRDELVAIRAFMDRGGHLLLADNGPGANALLAWLRVAVANRTLADPSSPNAGWVRANATVRGEDYPLLLRAASVLVPAPESDVEVLAWSHAEAFLDVNLDGRATEADLPGPLPVVLVAPAHRGGVHAALSDISLFTGIATPESPAEHGPFLAALLRMVLPSGGRILVDEARHPFPVREDAAYDGLGLLYNLRDNRATVAVPVGLLAAGLLWVLSRPAEERWGPHRPALSARPWPGSPPDPTVLRRRLALILLARKASLAIPDLELEPPDVLASMVSHDLTLQRALLGTATNAEWSTLEERFNRQTPER